jgi:hypothetical protein
MALLYVTEFAELAIGPGGRVGQIPEQPPLAEQALIATNGAVVVSNFFTTSTRVVRLHTDVVCAFEFGTNPVAVPAAGPGQTARMAANQTEYHGVPGGGTYKVAVTGST